MTLCFFLFRHVFFAGQFAQPGLASWCLRAAEEPADGAEGWPAVRVLRACESYDMGIFQICTSFCGRCRSFRRGKGNTYQQINAVHSSCLYTFSSCFRSRRPDHGGSRRRRRRFNTCLLALFRDCLFVHSFQRLPSWQFFTVAF